jgi:hypothetical protein
MLANHNARMYFFNVYAPVTYALGDASAAAVMQPEASTLCVGRRILCP